jgi:hypothetical protein
MEYSRSKTGLESIMTTQLPTPDPQKVKQTVVKLRQHRLAIEEATLVLEDLTAQLEYNARKKYLDRLSRQRSYLETKSEI